MCGRSEKGSYSGIHQPPQPPGAVLQSIAPDLSLSPTRPAHPVRGP